MKYLYKNFDRSYKIFWWWKNDFDVAIVNKLKLTFVSFDKNVSSRYLSEIYMIKHNTSSTHSLQSYAVCNLIKGHLERGPKQLVRHATEKGTFYSQSILA